MPAGQRKQRRHRIGHPKPHQPESANRQPARWCGQHADNTRRRRKAARQRARIARHRTHPVAGKPHRHHAQRKPDIAERRIGLPHTARGMQIHPAPIGHPALHRERRTQQRTQRQKPPIPP